MTTLQSCLLAIIFLVWACAVTGSMLPLFLGLSVVSLTWACYAYLSLFRFEPATVRADGLVWGV